MKIICNEANRLWSANVAVSLQIIEISRPGQGNVAEDDQITRIKLIRWIELSWKFDYVKTVPATGQIWKENKMLALSTFLTFS